MVDEGNLVQVCIETRDFCGFAHVRRGLGVGTHRFEVPLTPPLRGPV